MCVHTHTLYFCVSYVFCIYVHALQTADLAVDWVNEKLYWTEYNVGEVLVMDITQRQKRKLIVNGSTPVAVAVDPVTR